MKNPDRQVEQDALTWLMRVNDPNFADWESFEAWLAEANTHAEAYWRLAGKDADVVEALQAPSVESVVAPFERPRASKPRRYPVWAIAASLVVSVLGAGWLAWTLVPQPMSMASAPGERQTVRLGDGTEVVLDGDTEISWDRRSARRVTLAHGRALFRVTHDAKKVFTVSAGDAVITDIGTVFDVTRLTSGARVAVAEGSVKLEQAKLSRVLSPGQSVVIANGQWTQTAVTPSAIVGWTDKRLSYQNERLNVVADDVARALGVQLVLPPKVASRTFTGALSVDGPAESVLSRLAILTNLTVRQDTGKVWHLEPKSTP